MDVNWPAVIHLNGIIVATLVNKKKLTGHDHVFLPAIDPHRLGDIIINDLSPNTIGTVEVHFHGA